MKVINKPTVIIQLFSRPLWKDVLMPGAFIIWREWSNFDSFFKFQDFNNPVISYGNVCFFLDTPRLSCAKTSKTLLFNSFMLVYLNKTWCVCNQEFLHSTIARQLRTPKTFLKESGGRSAMFYAICFAHLTRNLFSSDSDKMKQHRWIDIAFVSPRYVQYRNCSLEMMRICEVSFMTLWLATINKAYKIYKDIYVIFHRVANRLVMFETNYLRPVNHKDAN